MTVCCSNINSDSFQRFAISQVLPNLGFVIKLPTTETTAISPGTTMHCELVYFKSRRCRKLFRTFVTYVSFSDAVF